MSSINLVETINSIRPEGQSELHDDHFMVKIEKHPGIDSPKFLGYVDVPDPNGGARKCKCYHLPKRECELMVMSESLEVTLGLERARYWVGKSVSQNRQTMIDNNPIRAHSHLGN